jgi:hypothetical protein
MTKRSTMLKALTETVSIVEELLKPQNARQRRPLSKKELAQSHRDLAELKKLQARARELESPKLIPKARTKPAKRGGHRKVRRAP